ncbi:beta-1,3-galactosyl-O-glycosyl-glycoprotein beta-1,6-N-acetylglucosaminyltransferase 7 [Chanos chanos]|uniref:Beta-1,3-galactosyl-O-glycosyl-glycoprotein beta-1,6-N-acetylglucosaminyltransferase 7 n=1 Tax=Chanos chanos TaxID=29144 RepID=A0A6J2VQV3_CHACN|nr:N-acetyllactosaminide beta-1,6-N-acetylglucosaminyl-transferase [Chanos chanos]
MLPLESTKCSFLICLGFGVLISAIIYLNTEVPGTPQTKAVQNHSLSCQEPTPDSCQAFLPSIPSTKWQRTDCQMEAYLAGAPLECSQMYTDLHFITTPLSKEEELFPLAFIITIHKKLDMFVRLLRAIYAPQNVYCIHVDDKASQDYKEKVLRLASCFPNVFLASASEAVTYAGFSRLQADINCMRDLVRSPLRWYRVINMCGQDFPIMSNLELVRYMKGDEWRDKNITPGIKQPPTMRYRTMYHYEEVKGKKVVVKGWYRKKGPPPHKLQLYFGTAYYSLTRAFVEFVLNSLVARDLLEWSKDTYSPDEHYWVTLNHIPDAPGSNVNGGWEGNIRAIKWKDQEGTSHQGCKGHYVRDICVYGMEDLPWIIQKNSLFANKFDSSSFPDAFNCMELWQRNKVLQQAMVPIQPSWLLTIQVNASIQDTATPRED